MSLPEAAPVSGPASRLQFVISSGVQLTGGEVADPDGSAAAGRSAAAGGRALTGVLRRHWIFAGLVVLAAALRGVVLVAYHPALIFPDSVRYLQYAHNFTTGLWSPDALRQSGYSVAIIPALLLHAPWLIPLAQHLAGLATAGLIYAVLIRSGTRPWLAAVAALPVLFDPLQLVLEQYVLTDTGAMLLIMAALAVLVWRRDGPRKRAAAAAGLLLGVAVTFRDQDLIMIVPAVLFLLVQVRPWRLLLTRLAAVTGCFFIPVIGYLGWFATAHGQWNFTTFDGAFLYGRVADFASCSGLELPGYEKPLCPAQPVAQRNADFYTWDPKSPQWTFTPPAGKSRDAVVRDFSLRILRHQPASYAEAVGRDLLYGFSPVRGAGPEQYSPAYLQFQTSVRPDKAAYASIAKLGYPAPSIEPDPAAFLTDYGRWAYLPGPVLAAGLVLALGGLVTGRARGRPSGAGNGQDSDTAPLLFTASAILILLPPAMFATFDWRYQLPQLSLIPVAAVLGSQLMGSHAIVRRRSAGIQAGRPA
jgi:dolichyl-phosphate-mannose-protein mannosyltransferase